MQVYYPSIWRVNKYGKYWDYFLEYLRWGDYNSLWASFKFVFFNSPTNKSWVSDSRMGKFKIRPNTTDFQFINYSYEKSVRQYMEGLMPSVKHFIDIGACIGEYDIWLAKQGVKCHAFEPVNYLATEENIRLNNVQDLVVLYKCGLGAQPSQVHFIVLDTVTGSSAINRDYNGKDFNVEIDTLDNIFDGKMIGSRDLVVIKLDVEGMEEEVIEGAAQFIKNTNSLQVIFEKYPGSDDDIERALGKYARFKSFRIDEANAVAIKIGDL
ncbi:MAG: FkbM family methyltransferase [Bernardetiaceae bacterium]|nr:FkbM family methyltransferase [Bernardetiaceae bacterium]